ncbi:molybdenum cofactor biosynthesis protein MoaE [soil metagenome]
MFSISSITIDSNELKIKLVDPRAGAFVTFEGWVRDHNQGKEVLTLEYEAYEALCQNEARQILSEAEEKFGVIDVHCVHRTGELKIGELAVWVGVSSAHRGAAFDACRYVIDEIKSRLPIWKKETYANGSSGWVNCQSHCGHSSSEQEAVPAQRKR